MKALMLEADWQPREGYQPDEYELKTRTALTSSSVWRNPKLSLKDMPLPEIKLSREVIIKVGASGVCGTDVHLYETDTEGYVLYPGLVRLPCIIGHEFAGIVEEVGPGTRELKKGDLVAVEQMIWCGECTPCRNGLPNYCANIEELGVTLAGGHAEYVKTEERYCWKIDSLMGIARDERGVCELGALAEPLAVAYNAMFVKAGGFKPGAYVAVHGAGPIGLGAVALARASGAGKVIVLEVNEARRRLSRELGADHVLDPVDIGKPHEAILDLTEGLGADVHVESAGAMGKTMPVMMKSLALNAQIVLIGRAAQEVPMYLEKFQISRNSLCGARGHAGWGTYPCVIRMMASRRIDVMPMITRRYPLEQVIEAIKEAGRRDGGKIMIDLI